jgi:hypothetical protein
VIEGDPAALLHHGQQLPVPQNVDFHVPDVLMDGGVDDS